VLVAADVVLDGDVGSVWPSNSAARFTLACSLITVATVANELAHLGGRYLTRVSAPPDP
jgi:hypothetical protein